jgi:hypothetical protein
MAKAKAKTEPKRARRHAGLSTGRARKQRNDPPRQVEALPLPEALPELAEHARVIRDLSKRAVEDIIEIGRRLTLAKKRLGHGHYVNWLEKEFAWSVGTALNFTHVYEFVEALKSKNKNFTDLDIATLNIAPSAMYTLAQPGTPLKWSKE